MAMFFALVGGFARRSASVALAPVLLAILALATVGMATSAEAARAKRTTARAQTIAAIASAPVTLPAALPAPRAVAPVTAPLVAAISLNAQSITIYSGTDVVARSAISSGMSGHRTPTGVFSIIQKARYHESNIYDNAPMPFMQRLTWSGVAFTLAIFRAIRPPTAACACHMRSPNACSACSK